MIEHDWIDLGNGRKVYRKVGPISRGPRSDLACPQIMKPFAEPVQSMADGKYYSSKTELARTYRASGNPSGQEFIELGTETAKATEYVPDAQERREHVREAIRDVVTGNLPPEIAAIE